MQQEILPFKFVMHSLKLQELHKARRRVNDVNLMTTAYTNSCYLMSDVLRLFAANEKVFKLFF